MTNGIAFIWVDLGFHTDTKITVTTKDGVTSVHKLEASWTFGPVGRFLIDFLIKNNTGVEVLRCSHSFIIEGVAKGLKKARQVIQD